MVVSQLTIVSGNFTCFESQSDADFNNTRPPIKYVLDVTIAYPNGIPLSLVSLGFGTREKCDIAVNYKIYNADEVGNKLFC
ncbi:hypothetical protein ANCCAN_19769 [Ancylostoma caninum]|uniref:Uncharacterized protein n=1 Tax=Ancylostoma caninum TaxID=29170 RepID=A0A368FQE2_ANCCA|nr:hypothetical protein ANCCAN_19769 [Ancylostoma caninum]